MARRSDVPRSGLAELVPVILLDGGAALRGDVTHIEIAPDKWIQPPGSGTIIPAPVGPGFTPVPGPPLKLRWNFDAIVIGVSMAVRSLSGSDPTGARALSAIGCRITISSGKNDDLFLVGDGGDFVPAAGVHQAMTVRPAPVYRLVRQGDTWTVQFNNRSLLGEDWAPELLFAVRLLDLSCPPETTEIEQAR